MQSRATPELFKHDLHARDPRDAQRRPSELELLRFDLEAARERRDAVEDPGGEGAEDVALDAGDDRQHEDRDRAEDGSLDPVEVARREPRQATMVRAAPAIRPMTT